MRKYIFILTIPLFFTITLDRLINFSKITKKENITSAKINEIYSEKFIQDIEMQKFNLNNLDPNLNVSKATLELIPDSWQNNFSKEKSNFIKTVFPLIAFENKKILLERSRLQDIKKFLNYNKTLSNENIKHLYKISKKYKINIKNKHKIDMINELLLKVNIIPNSIVLAQAVNESGWGKSRFAKEHNALFGQYTYDENNGVIPNNRLPGKKHLIKNFSSIDKSVESYFININTHYAYEEFRRVRSLFNVDDINENVKLLTQNLNSYAEDKSYVEIINSIIDSNNLKQFDLMNESFIKS